MSRKELAELLGVGYSKISDYENGYTRLENVTVGNLDRIAAALGCKIDDLIH